MSPALTPTEMLAAPPFDVAVAFAVFARVGAMFMTAPAFGDHTLSPRIRLAGALAVAFAMTPVAAPHYPAGLAALPAPTLAGIIMTETAIGLFLGLSARFFFAALNVAGQTIALQMGLSLAQIFDPTQLLQGAIIGGFLAVLGVTMIFATDLHHLLLAALADSYALFAPGAPLPVGDMSAAMIDALSAAFSLGVRLAAPFIVFGLVFYAGAGVLSRLMPQAQVFFMLMPANLILGLLLLMLTSGVMMTVFLDAFEGRLVAFLR